jgi:phosphoglycerate dehydrogenase-like enzyme
MEQNFTEVLITINFPDNLIRLLQEISPRLKINVHPAARPDEIPVEEWARAEVLYTDRVLPTPQMAPNLRWIQFHYAGVDFAISTPILQKPDLIATTLSGAASPQMAEYALGMMLALGHKLPDLLDFQQRAEYPQQRWERFRPREIRGSTVGIMGYGSIGRELARILRPMGATILAAKRDIRCPQDNGYTPPGLGDPGGDLFNRLYPIQALRSMLKECDFVIVTLPLTSQTRDLIGAEELAVMKPTAFLIHLSRGGIVNENALVSALEDKRIAGAAVDVFVEEPLPASSPLWKAPNLIITPHISGFSFHYHERAMALFSHNLRLYLNNAPLSNLIHPDLGY